MAWQAKLLSPLPPFSPTSYSFSVAFTNTKDPRSTEIRYTLSPSSPVSLADLKALVAADLVALEKFDAVRAALLPLVGNTVP